MKNLFWPTLVLLLCSHLVQAAQYADIDTSMGRFTVELFASDAPQTVAQFQKLAKKGWYKDRLFYRVVKDFVIQTGSGNGNDPTTRHKTLPDEFNEHPPVKGALAIAKGAAPNSGSTEFFVCLQDMPGMKGNYVVFAQVVAGMEVVDAIASVPVEEKWSGADNRTPFHKPLRPVSIKKISLRESSDGLPAQNPPSTNPPVTNSPATNSPATNSPGSQP